MKRVIVVPFFEGRVLRMRAKAKGAISAVREREPWEFLRVDSDLTSGARATAQQIMQDLGRVHVALDQFKCLAIWREWDMETFLVVCMMSKRSRWTFRFALESEVEYQWMPFTKILWKDHEPGTEERICRPLTDFLARLVFKGKIQTPLPDVQD